MKLPFKNSTRAKIVCLTLLAGWTALVLFKTHHESPAPLDLSMAPSLENSQSSNETQPISDMTNSNESLNGDLQLSHPLDNQAPQLDQSAVISPTQPAQAPRQAQPQVESQPEMTAMPQEQASAVTTTSESKTNEISATHRIETSLKNEIAAKIPHSAKESALAPNSKPVEKSIDKKVASAQTRERKVSTWNRRDQKMDTELEMEIEGEGSILEGRRAAFQRKFDSDMY